MKSFKFELGAYVMLEMSGETGQVIGRAEYQHLEDQFFVRYVAGDGRQVENWISASALVAQDVPKAEPDVA